MLEYFIFGKLNDKKLKLIQKQQEHGNLKKIMKNVQVNTFKNHKTVINP